MRLHEDKELFRQAIDNTASYFKIDPSISEIVWTRIDRLISSMAKVQLIKQSTSLHLAEEDDCDD